MKSLTPWRPFEDLERWRRGLEGRLPRMFEGWPFERRERELVPPIESFVKDHTLVLRADVPGMDAKDIDVSVLGNVITIKGERRDEKEAKEDDYVRREISYGAFRRQMTLPDGVAAGQIKAEFKNGVVEITMPVAEELHAQKVPVESK